MDKRDYYEVLGVNKNSTPEEIKKAYRQKAMQYHPDRNPDDKEAEEKFKEAAEAYEILGNPDKKARYDRFGHAGVSGAAGAGGFSGFNDINDIFSHFADIFGGGRGGGFGFDFGFGSGSTGNTAQRVRKGGNLRIKVKLTLEEAAVTTHKKIKLKKYVPCNHCGGTGAKDTNSKVTCPTCHGRGQVVRQQRSMFGIIQQASICPQCNGSGEIIKNPCTYCHGNGIVQGEEIMDITIPAGIDDEMQLSLRNKGHAAANGGVNGDLIIAIEVADHPTFERDGSNLYLNYYISFPQAALGSVVEIPTLDGHAKIKITPGTQGGQILRLQGKGMPELHSSRRGDLIVNVNVWTPKSLSKEEKEILEKLSTHDNFVPKPGQKDRSVFKRVRQFFND